MNQSYNEKKKIYNCKKFAKKTHRKENKKKNRKPTREEKVRKKFSNGKGRKMMKE